MLCLEMGGIRCVFVFDKRHRSQLISLNVNLIAPISPIYNNMQNAA